MWFAAAALIGLAILCVMWPALRRLRTVEGAQTSGPAEHDQAVRDLYQARLVELARESEDGVAAPETLVALRRELGLVLLTEQDGVAEDLGAEVVQPSAQSGSPDGAHIANPKNKQWGYGLWLVGALVPLCAVSIFFSLADPSLRQIKGAERVLQLNEAEHRAELESWRMRLQRRVESQPDDSKSWYLLGHTHLKLANFVSAEQALATTYQLARDDISVKVSWLQARYLVAQGVLDERSRTLAAELLEQQPNLSIVLEILAMDAFRSGQRGEAITLLNRALSGSPPSLKCVHNSKCRPPRCKLTCRRAKPYLTMRPFL